MATLFAPLGKILPLLFIGRGNQATRWRQVAKSGFFVWNPLLKVTRLAKNIAGGPRAPGCWINPQAGLVWQFDYHEDAIAFGGAQLKQNLLALGKTCHNLVERIGVSHRLAFDMGEQ